MTTSKELLLAILAMDSYNQGYGKGLETGATRIGSATLKDNPASLDDSNWQSTGFYAAAYDTDYGTVIAYRGTDNNLNTPWSTTSGITVTVLDCTP